MNPIPEQLINGNICPINPNGKGNWYISKDKVLAIAKHLKVDPSSIQQEAWSEKNGKFFISWKGFYKLPEPIQTHIKDMEFKKGLGYGIKTGNQQDGTFIIVFDCDNDNNKATEYKDFLISLYGNTFIRDTPSGGFHVYYECPEGSILKDNMHIDLRHYITIDNKPFDLEVKQGSFIRENGTPKKGIGYSTFMDLPIKKLDPEIDLIKAIKNKYPTAKQNKEFIENETSTPYNNKESLKVLDSELLDILNKKYLPSYISTTLKGHRDNLIIPATFGFLIKRNMPRQQMEGVLDWINNVAENKKQGTPNIRHYNFDNIPDILSGSGVLRKHGFNEFVDSINNLDPEYISTRQTQKVLGEHTINTISMDYPTKHLPMFEILQDIVGIHSRSHKHILKMVYYTMVSTINADSVVYINNARHDLRISTIFVGKQGQGKTEILNMVANILKDVGMVVHRPTSFHAEQWIGKTKPQGKKEEKPQQIMGYLNDDVIIIDEAKNLISNPDFAEVRRTARISQNRYGSSPVEKKNVDTHNEDKISYDSKSVLLYGVQDMKLDAEDFIIEGDVRRYAVSVLDNETMDNQEDIIRSVMDSKREYISSQEFTDYLNKIPRLPDTVFIKLEPKERVLYERAVINLNDRANSYSTMVSDYFGTLGAEYTTLFLKFVVNYSLIRMVKDGIDSQQPKITENDILFAYVDCLEMLEHRYEWTHFYLVEETKMVHKGAKYIKEIDVLSNFDIGQPLQKRDIIKKIEDIYKVSTRQAQRNLKKYIENGFLTEINDKKVEIKKLPGKRIERKDDLSIEMYNHALEKIENIKTPSIKAQSIEENSDWNQKEAVQNQTKINQ